MDTSISQNLRHEFAQLLKRGDEEAARRFLLEHLKEFPQDTQDAITIAFLEDALSQSANGNKTMANFRAQGMAILETLGEAKEEAEKQAKLVEIKKGI